MTDAAEEGVQIEFPDGLVGMPEFVHHALRAVPDSDLLELVSLDDPAMGFFVAPGDDVRSGLTEALLDRELIGPDETVLVLLSVHGDPPAVTANLAGPVAVDLGQGTGRQLVVEDGAFPLRAALEV